MADRRSRAQIAIDRADAAGLMDDPARTARVVRQWIALGGDSALLAGAIAARTQTSADEPRNRAIGQLARTFVGGLTEVAEDCSHALRRYGRDDWRGDRNLLSAPAAYQSQPRLLAAYHATRANGGPFTLSSRQIARILKSSTICFVEAIPGHENALLAAGLASAHNSHHQQFGMSFSGNRSRRARGKIPTHHTNEDSTLNALTPQSNAEFIEAMKRAPAGQAVLKAETARVITARQKLLDELAALDAKAAVDFPKLDKAVQVEIAATRAVELALKAQNAKLSAANFAKSDAVIAYDAGRRRIEAELRDTRAAKVIDEFQISMRDEIDAAMKKHEGGRVQENRPLARDPRERILVHGYGNRLSVKNRLDAIHGAIAAAEALRIAADQGDLVAKLDALRAGLPAIESAVIPSFGGVAA